MTLWLMYLDQNGKSAELVLEADSEAKLKQERNEALSEVQPSYIVDERIEK